MAQLAPGTRKLLIHCWCIAMRGDLDSALTLLDQASTRIVGEGKLLDEVMILALKAELLFLNCQEADSLEVYRIAIEPKLDSLPQDIGLVLGHNRNDVARAIFAPNSVRQFYELHDQVRVAGTNLWDAAAIVYAYEAAAEGEHYDALPAFWKELVETYRRGCWRYYRLAAGRFARECFQLGWLDKAAHNAMVAQDKELAKLIAEYAILRQDSTLISEIVRNLLANANLKRHVFIACSLISEMFDAIPDSDINDLSRWILNQCSVRPNTQSELTVVRAAWETIAKLAPRLTPELARQVVEIGVNHSLWATPSFSRKEIIAAVTGCLSLVPVQELSRLAEKALPLATTQKHDLDYVDSIRLLCDIAERGDKKVRVDIGNALYPTAVVDNAILMQVALLFGRELADKEEANRMAERVAEEIMRQVQRVGAKEEPPVAEGIGRITVGTEQETVSVNIASLTGLRAVLNQRKLLSKDSIHLLIEAILSMVSEPNNIPANKTSLIDSIVDLADCLTSELINLVFEKLAPVAEGNIEESIVLKAAGDPNNPLNRFKTNVGGYAQVQGQALHALAHIEGMNPGVYGEKLTSIFEIAVTSSDPEVRRSAFGAARWLTKLSEQAIMNLLLGTRDPDPRTAEGAYVALSLNKSLRVPDHLWHQLVYSLTMTSTSPIPRLRRAAAYTIANLRDQYPNDEAATKLERLEQALAQDVCFSVRLPLSHPSNSSRAASSA